MKMNPMNLWRPLACFAAVTVLVAAPATLVADDGAQTPPTRDGQTRDRARDGSDDQARDRGRDRTPPQRGAPQRGGPQRGGPQDGGQGEPLRGRDGEILRGRDGEILRGPAVERDADAPGRPFGTRPDRGAGRPMGEQAEIEIPSRIWFAQFRNMEIDEQQRERLQSLLDTHAGEIALFEAEHGERLQELERAARLARAEAENDDAEEVRRLRAAIEEIRAKEPKMEKVQENAVKLLTAEQRAEFERRLQAVEERLRMQQQRRRQAAQQGASPERDPAGRRDMPRQRDGVPPQRGREGAPPQRPTGRDGAPPRGRDGATPPPRGRDGATPPARGRDGVPPQRPTGRDGVPPRGRDGATPPPRGRDGATPPPRGRDGTPPDRGTTPPGRGD